LREGIERTKKISMQYEAEAPPEITNPEGVASSLITQTRKKYHSRTQHEEKRESGGKRELEILSRLERGKK